MNPRLGLLMVALLWGTSFPIVRVALRSVSAAEFVSARFALAGLAFLSVLAVGSIRREVWRILIPGLGIGLLNFLIFTTQTLSMETISGPRAAFITGGYVIFVPLLCRIFGRPSPSKKDWFACFLAFVGLTLLASPSEMRLESIQIGDVFAIICAFCAAIKIHSLTRLAESGANPIAMSFLQVWGVVLIFGLCWPFMPSTWFEGSWNATTLACVFFCAWVISVGTFYLQSSCQRSVPPQQTALIFCLEPVFATLFCYIFIQEALTPEGLIGGGLILTAQLLTPLLRGSVLVRSYWTGTGKVFLKSTAAKILRRPGNNSKGRK